MIEVRNKMVVKWVLLAISMAMLITTYSMPNFFKIKIKYGDEEMMEQHIGLSESLIKNLSTSTPDQHSSTKNLLCTGSKSDEEFNYCESINRLCIMYIMSMVLVVLAFTPGLCNVMVTAGIMMLIFTIDTYVSMTKLKDDLVDKTKANMAPEMNGRPLNVEESGGPGLGFAIATTIFGIVLISYGWKQDMPKRRRR